MNDEVERRLTAVPGAEFQQQYAYVIVSLKELNEKLEELLR
tara:strand:- start:306 stop:428 length:123 start_codon:yes stop_codon:yes gene_type:complete